MRIALITFEDAAHAAAADVLCPLSALPEGWERFIVDHGADALALDPAPDIIAYPFWPEVVGDLDAPGRLVVTAHHSNTPMRHEAPWMPGVITVAARPFDLSAATRTSHGPGLWVSMDTSSLYQNNAQSWACFSAACYLARAWAQHGTPDAAHASLVAAARAASGQSTWAEATGYGVLPSLVLPAPGALLSTDTTPEWALSAGHTGIVAEETRGGRVGTRIVVGPGESRFRATSTQGAPYQAGRIYRRRQKYEVLGSKGADMLSRASGTTYRAAPNQTREIDLWEVASSQPESGGQWTLQSGLINEEAPGAPLDVFIWDCIVDTYEAAAPTLPAIAAPALVAPFGVTATEIAPGVVRISWSRLAAGGYAGTRVAIDGVVRGETAATSMDVRVQAGIHAVRLYAVGAGGSAVTADHAVLQFEAAGTFAPDAPTSVTATRVPGGLRITWAEVGWAEGGYRVEVAPGRGAVAMITRIVDDYTTDVLWDSRPAEIRVVARGAYLDSQVARGYALATGTPAFVPPTHWCT